MRKATYIKKMKKHEERFDKLWQKIVADTNEFKRKNPDIDMASFKNNIEQFADQLALSGGWIYDRLENEHMTRENSKLRKKIRKALGYTY